MKIIRHRFRIPGWKQGASTATAEDRTTPVSLEKKIKKKALLIGIQQVREEPTSVRTPSPPLSPGFGHMEDLAAAATAKLKRAKTKLKAKKNAKKNALKGPHRDVKAMRELLIEVYAYDPADIVVLIDDDIGEHIQPTRDNIMDQMRKLVEGAAENDRFFFHFSGHSTQEDTDDVEEEDRKNEFIVTSDGKKIKDDVLRATLVDPLPPKSSLFAVFDSCHSGTLLDLKHFRCNRVYVPWINKGNRRTASLWNLNRLSSGIQPHLARMMKRAQETWARTSIDHVLTSPKTSLPTPANHIDLTNPTPDPGPNAKANGPEPVKTKSLSIITNVQARQRSNSRSMWLDSENQFASPVALYCNGFCRENEFLRDDGEVMADVISLSSTKDSQKSWEDKNGHSMTQGLVKILRQNPHPTLHNLLTLVSHDIHTFYIGLHARARDYRKKVRARNVEMARNGKQPREGVEVEMNNFQDPQLSSDRPLDLSRQFYP
ncbi:hypothetical protein GALMADRAFT_222842 [Galerina marginata CBS 339.88]|uniref:Peptidase C14 caspase domain-containing protein n=1 Tax=Galerina marginata (strain CBS 339.88) TaxID=685588 RepID=A0A067TLT4_GALM3|nr:hypothetical protein GALMADRAFT_222842 [Galerina marginata CBS 339.88]